VLLDGRKAGGILVESGLYEAALDHVVLGIGLNVSTAPPPEAVMFPATSVEAAAGRPVDRLALLRDLVERLAARYADLPQGGDRLYTAWDGRLAWQGQRVIAHTPEGDYHGCFEGTDPDGALRLRAEEGGIRRVLAGDVSLRRL
jgi:BirA family biotin operon repressor/biotin-[acetyl-CoA-carboxylase] ligase